MYICIYISHFLAVVMAIKPVREHMSQTALNLSVEFLYSKMGWGNVFLFCSRIVKLGGSNLELAMFPPPPCR